MAEIDTNATFHLYPEIKASVVIVPKSLIASIGITGGFSKNSFNELRNNNPYINSVVPQSYQNNKFEVYGQLKGKITQGFDFDLTLTNSSISNMPFFVNDSSTAYQNTFDVILDDVNLLHGRATFSFQAKETVKILFKINYYDYTMTNEFRPWHKPEYDLTLSTKFSIRDIIFIRADITHYGKSFAKEYTQFGLIESVRLQSWADANLGIEYRYTKNLSIFADFHNLGNTSFMRWNNYPVQKFSIIGGLSYSF
jgi:outer membrane receptor for ferrienterochelin and colicin